MDAGNSKRRTSFALLMIEQVERDKQQAERDEQRAKREEDRQVAQAERDEQRAKREEKQVPWQKWQVFASVIGIVAVVAAVIALKNQQDAAASQDQDSRYSSVSQLSLDVDQKLAENPDLISCFRDYGECYANPALDQKKLDKAELIAVYIVDFYQYLYTQLESLNYLPNSGVFVFAHTPEASRTDENWVTWGETIYMGFRNSTMECKALADGEDAYEWKFVHAVWVTLVCPGLPDPGPSPYPFVSSSFLGPSPPSRLLRG